MLPEQLTKTDNNSEVLLLVKNRQNKILLKKFLAKNESITSFRAENLEQRERNSLSPAKKQDLLTYLKSFDLIIIDQQYLISYQYLLKKLQELPECFLPILLLTEKSTSAIYSYLGEIANDIASLPIGKDILENKINNLLQIRHTWKRLNILQRKFSLIFNNINDAVFILKYNPQQDGPGEFFEVNEKMLQIMGSSREKILALEADEVLTRIFSPVKMAELQEKIASQKEALFEAEIISFANDKTPVEINAQLTTLAGEKLLFCVARDISEKKAKEKELNYALFHDHLTGLYNRRFFEAEMERLDTKRQFPLAIIMIDINGLKIINDSYGHDKGDKMLQKAAKILQDSVRAEDIVARLGGDEFALLLPKTNQATTEIICERIREKCQASSTDEIPISLGLGFSLKERTEQDIYKVLDKADSNMQKDKLTASRSTKNRVVKGLLNTLGTKTAETEEHTIRMTNLALNLGHQLNLNQNQLNDLALLATLHDIGKVVIPEAVLNKPGDLNKAEWDKIKEHPERGYRIALATEEFAHVAEYILYHHEKWDGSGYPEGLKKEEIPLLARIIAIIDAYDVMTNRRPYKEPISKEQALREIKNCAGSQFDPRLAEKFNQIIA